MLAYDTGVMSMQEASQGGDLHGDEVNAGCVPGFGTASCVLM